MVLRRWDVAKAAARQAAAEAEEKKRSGTHTLNFNNLNNLNIAQIRFCCSFKEVRSVASIYIYPSLLPKDRNDQGSNEAACQLRARGVCGHLFT